MDLSGRLIKGTGSYEIKELASQDSVLNHLDKGSKHLECTVAGTVAFKSDQVYGEWEFDVYKGADGNNVGVQIISPDFTPLASTCYQLRLVSTEAIGLYDGASGYIALTANSYIVINTWYRIKVTRTPDGEFTVFIKGGTFGSDDWTIVDVGGGIGTNPIVDISHITTKYFLFDLDAGDRITNIIMRNAVQQ